MDSLLLLFFVYFVGVSTAVQEQCSANNNEQCSSKTQHVYTKSILDIKLIKSLQESYVPCVHQNCSCYDSTLKEDLKPFQNGIQLEDLKKGASRGVWYQIIDHQVFRSQACMFPARCLGVEHYLKLLAPELPDLDLIVNVRDWPQVSRHYESHPIPVFSFSKTNDYYDIMYPAWSFWEGGPATKLHPTGIGRWDLRMKELIDEALLWNWEKKKRKGFFRGSRTSAERDALVLLSREQPDLVDAAYTKNQAWKSKEDTLGEDPVPEVSFKDHCHYKYLFNYRGVAASFRLKFLFVCRSLVLHVGNEWKEFFYDQLKPWVHYVPVDSRTSKNDLKSLLRALMAEDELSHTIAVNGYDFITSHLRPDDVICYWKQLLLSYSTLLKYKPIKDKSFIQV